MGHLGISPPSSLFLPFPLSHIGPFLLNKSRIQVRSTLIKGSAFEMHTSVKISDLQSNFGHDRAVELAKMIWAATGFRFRADHALTKDPKKQRARMKMDRFVCDSWLDITVDEDDLQLATVRMTHQRSHTPYVDISIPKQAKDTVESMKNLPASKIWEAVLKANPKTELNEKQIYRYWAELNAGAWRLHNDQVQSAISVLEKYEDLAVEIIPITAEDGISAITFAFREILDEYGSKAKYDPRKARKVFSFLDPTWAPGVTAGWLENGVIESDAQTEGPQEEGENEEDSAPGCEICFICTYLIILGIQEPTCLPPLFVLTQGDRRVPIYPNPPKMKKELPQSRPPEYRSTIVQKYRTHGHQHPIFPSTIPMTGTAVQRRSTVVPCARCTPIASRTSLHSIPTTKVPLGLHFRRIQQVLSFGVVWRSAEARGIDGMFLAAFPLFLVPGFNLPANQEPAHSPPHRFTFFARHPSMSLFLPFYPSPTIYQEER
ncbi:hypothetical protein B0H13DRAFT_1862109 [Mycena leptocephala]|nr:hypothetical protein B0H13DRAFT_1862109 [Mycena leptocephala]